MITYLSLSRNGYEQKESVTRKYIRHYSKDVCDDGGTMFTVNVNFLRGLNDIIRFDVSTYMCKQNGESVFVSYVYMDSETTIKNVEEFFVEMFYKMNFKHLKNGENDG